MVFAPPTQSTAIPVVAAVVGDSVLGLGENFW